MRTASALHCGGQQGGYFRTASKRRGWGLKPDCPMVAPNYSAQRQALAKQIGLGHKPAPPPAPDPKPKRRRKPAA